MGMADRAREMAEGRDQDSLLRKQEEENRRREADRWRREMISELSPLITEYAQALAKTGLRYNPNRSASRTSYERYDPFFEPKLVLGSTRVSGPDAMPSWSVTCQFRVERRGKWHWTKAPEWRSDPLLEWVPMYKIEAALTEKLSAAMKAAQEEKASSWWRF